jgi:hypothetical protein
MKIHNSKMPLVLLNLNLNLRWQFLIGWKKLVQMELCSNFTAVYVNDPSMFTQKNVQFEMSHAKRIAIMLSLAFKICHSPKHYI